MKTWGLRRLSQRVSRARRTASFSAAVAWGLSNSVRRPPPGQKTSCAGSSGEAIAESSPSLRRNATIMADARGQSKMLDGRCWRIARRRRAMADRRAVAKRLPQLLVASDTADLVNADLL